MRFLLSTHIPYFDRVLLIESGSRRLLEDLLPGFYKLYGSDMKVDLFTCYGGVPAGFREAQGEVFRAADFPGSQARGKLYGMLRERRYSVVCMICAAEPILTKWKWMLALRLRRKVLILNENGDYFWFDRGQWRTVLHFALFRAGMTGPDAAPTIARLLLFPFTLLYLLLYAAAVHLRRLFHLSFGGGKART